MDHGGWGSGGPVWIGRTEGFLEEVLHTSSMCGTGGEVILVESWEQVVWPQLGSVPDPCTSLLSSPCPCDPRGGGGVSGRCPPFLRDVAGVAGGGGFWPLSDLAPSLWASVYPPVEWALDPRGPSSMWCYREAAAVMGAGG